ncbi:hypothetical protein [Pyrococcus sp. ST04]|uniref:hypothetical protein n=1 Tax=Pyrococcus sp. ST04 TaxID=1183377 RepID=UPI000AE690BB|nr:hypothetical protein [Pyrococcus sp. ST04]
MSSTVISVHIDYKEEEKKRKALERFIEVVKTLPGVPEGRAKRLVREDRDSH